MLSEMVFDTMFSQSKPLKTIASKPKPALRAITSAPANRSSPVETPRRNLDVNHNQDVGFFTDFSPYGQEEPLALEINMRNLENLTLLDNLNSVNGINGIENNENLAFFQDYEGHCNTPFLPDGDDSKEPNVSRTVRVPTSEHVAEIVGRQGCKIKDLRARTNTYIKTPMRTEPPVFVVTGKETAVNLVISEINSAAEHFTQIRASRNHHKNGLGGGGGGGGEVIKPVTREGDVVLHVTVPYRVVGLVVGLKGQTIKQIQQDTDTFIVTPNRDKAPIFEIRGQPSNVERARIMIERHIEVRTRNCRLQDTTNLQNNCDDQSRFGGSNDYHYSYTDSPSSPPNGQSNHLSSNNYINGGSTNGYNNSTLHSPNYNNNHHHNNNINNNPNTSPQSSSSNSYNTWRSYSGLLESNGGGGGSPSHNAPIQTWSNATSEYNTTTNNSMGNGHHAPSSSTSIHNMRGMQYSSNMSVGRMSSNSGSVSASPPQDFLSSGGSSFSNSRQIPGHMGGGNSSTNGRLNDLEPTGDGSSSFSGFPLFSTPSNAPNKSSLVLTNIIQNSSTNGTLGNRDMTSHGINGFGSGRNGHDVMGFSSSSSTDYFRGGFSDHSMFGQMATSSDGNGFPSGDSSPASKSCSLSESSGSQGSPTPRMCKVCEEADVVAALVPCGHNHFCMECAEGIVNKSSEMDRKCPICSAAASDVLRILA